jgi:hypothetical protein
VLEDVMDAWYSRWELDGGVDWWAWQPSELFKIDAMINIVELGEER